MIVYFITSQPLETERFLMYLNICILTSLVAQSIGLLIGAAMSVEVKSIKYIFKENLVRKCIYTRLISSVSPHFYRNFRINIRIIAYRLGYSSDQ